MFLKFNKFIDIASKSKQGDFHFDAKKFCASMFPDIDTNKDGMIDFEEFFKLSQLLPGIWVKNKKILILLIKTKMERLI